MRLFDTELHGEPVRVLAADDPRLTAVGLAGVEVVGRRIEERDHTVVQVLLDDDAPGFDTTLLDAPVVVDVVAADGTLITRELLDHDATRRQLQAERLAGRSEIRGVLVLTDGELPPPWVRLAFVPLPLEATAGTRMVLRRTSVQELLAGVEAAFVAGEMTDQQRQVAIRTIDQRHPPQR